MRKVFISFVAIFFSCNIVDDGGFGLGGKNAAQFIKEKTNGQTDIASIETIREDSFLCDIGFGFAEIELAKKGVELLKDNISKDEFESIIDSISNATTDVLCSWQMGKEFNDSLRKLKKYDGMWRKVYTVRVTMKSGMTNNPRVLMDEDGITPRETEREMMRSIEDHTQSIINTYNNTILSY